MDITAEEFNEKYDVGTPVFFWPGWRKDEQTGKDLPAMVSKTSTPAWEMPGGQQVVTVEGRAGGMWLQHVEVIPDFIVEHLKTPEESQAAAMLGLLGLRLEDFIGSMRQLMEPYYKLSTTCDGKCAKVEDLEEELESAKGATKVAVKLSDELLEKHLASEAKVKDLEKKLSLQTTNVVAWRNKATAWETRAEAAEAKVEELRGMLATQHNRLTVVEGEKNDAEQQLANSQHAAELAELEISQKQDEIERAYEMLDPNTEIDDRVKSMPTLVEELIAENQRLERELREKPHKGCRELEAGLNKQLQAMTASRNNAFQELDELRNQILDIVRSNVVRAKPGD